MRSILIMSAALLTLASTTAHATPASSADQDLGKRYVKCGQLMIAVGQSGEGDTDNQQARTGIAMTALGGMLLGAHSIDALQPHLDVARASIQAQAKGPNGQTATFKSYSDCVELDSAQTPALVERFKGQMAKDLKAAGQN